MYCWHCRVNGPIILRSSACLQVSPSTIHTFTEGLVSHSTEGLVSHSTEGLVSHSTEGLVSHSTEDLVSHSTEGLVSHSTEGLVSHSTEGLGSHSTEGLVSSHEMSPLNHRHPSRPVDDINQSMSTSPPTHTNVGRLPSGHWHSGHLRLKW